ncbi:MAG TPA: prolipoprotein diacylglyceryl transferase [Candidatus Acidoferrales bacterium]|nr:prolipoprotein diacylglyceryl transferase [Candidatus Acidoferrales bacterium]
MLNLVITDPFPPGFQVGPFQVRFYGMAYAIAFIVGTLVASRQLERRGVPRARCESIAFWTIIFGLVGARLYFVVQSGWYWYLTHPQHILAFWEGGMAFFGAIFAALIVLLWMSRRHRLNFWDLLDAGVLFAAVGQPIGRIGNVLNGEILGPPSNLPWAIRYTNPASMATHLGVAYQPANVYEAVATLAILAVLLYVRRRGVPPGVLGLLYVVMYPVSQLIVFHWRTDYETPPLLWGLKQAQLTALAVLIVVLPLMVWIWLRTRNRGARLEGPTDPGVGTRSAAAAASEMEATDR